jgi:hypothetical protein
VSGWVVVGWCLIMDACSVPHVQHLCICIHRGLPPLVARPVFTQYVAFLVTK